MNRFVTNLTLSSRAGMGPTDTTTFFPLLGTDMAGPPFLYFISIWFPVRQSISASASTDLPVSSEMKYRMGSLASSDAS